MRHLSGLIQDLEQNQNQSLINHPKLVVSPSVAGCACRRTGPYRAIVFMFLIACIVFSIPLKAQSIRAKINKGNEKYHAEKYEEALTNYNDALLDDPLNEAAIFNEATANYKLKKYDLAIESLQKLAGSEDLNLSAKAYYNIGNAQFQQDKLQEAIAAYKRSLELNPDDADAKHNLELARAKLKENAQKQPQNKQQNQQNQQQQDQSEQNKQGQKQEQQQNQQDKKDQQEQQKKEKEKSAEEKKAQEQKAQEKQAQEQKPDKDKLSKEEAERILKALREQEQNNEKKKAPIRGNGRYTDKDW